MKTMFITLVFLFGIAACSSNQENSDHKRPDLKENDYILKNPCWGFNNLERLYIKWNWVELRETKKLVKVPLMLDIKIVRLGKMNEELFSANFYESKNALIPTSKKYNLYSPFFTYEIYVKDIKNILIADKLFFSNFEFDEYSVDEWEEKDELSKVYGLNTSKHKEAMMVSTESKRGCNSSFMKKKTPHLLKVTLYDSLKKEIISAYIPLNKIKRTPPYFNRSELYRMGQDYKSDLYPAVMNLSVLLEKF